MASLYVWAHASKDQPTSPPLDTSTITTRMPSDPLQPRFSVARLRTLVHTSSSPTLGKMSSLISPRLPTPRIVSDSAIDVNKLSTSQSTTSASTLSRSNSNSSQHPDLNDATTTLSMKLVNAINHQAQLDGTLQTTRHELERARAQLDRLEAAAKRHANLISQGLLIAKEDVDKEKALHAKELQDEQEKRIKAENEKKKGEQELADLTAALFTEANTMVEAARRETAAEQKRTEQYQNQLQDAETLLQSHQAQLQELKAVMERISSEKDDDETNTHLSTTPSTPAVFVHDKMSRFLDAPTTPGIEEVTPDHPLKFSHLVQPVLREDVLAFKEFNEMIRTNWPHITSQPASRISSGNFGSMNVLGLGATSSSTSPKSPKFAPPVSGTSSPRDAVQSGPALKDTKVYKRAVLEDIEPTLRLDIAPGISWMGRRTVLSSMTSGSLAIEPMPVPLQKFRGPVHSCALCGENRISEKFVRHHRFRTSDAEDAQKYPLCDGCLNRVRSVCDYISFLRMIKDGHWRAETEEDIKNAWEESVRLRERMFWQRIGGGVVPVMPHHREQLKSSPKVSQEGGRPGEISEDDQGVAAVIPEETSSHPLEQNESASVEQPTTPQDEESNMHKELRDSLASKSSSDETAMPDDGETPFATPSKESKRLSMTVPGAFD